MSTILLYSPAEAAEFLGLSEVRVRQFCMSRRLGQKVGRQWVIPADELHQFAKIPRKEGKPGHQKKDSK